MKYFIFALVMALSFISFGQEISNDTPGRNNPPKVREFDEEKLNDARSQEDFRYDLMTDPEVKKIDEEKSWFTKVMEAIGKFLLNIFDALGPVVAYLAFFGLIVFLAFLILQNSGYQAISIQKSSAPIEAMEEIENIHELDFDKLLKEALESGNFRLATRIYYLKLLKILSDRKVINWEINKTNRDYLYEIKSGKVKEAFRSATRTYEYVWYGDIELDGEHFSKVKNLYTSIFSDINGGKRK